MIEHRIYNTNRYLSLNIPHHCHLIRPTTNSISVVCESETKQLRHLVRERQESNDIQVWQLGRPSVCIADVLSKLLKLLHSFRFSLQQFLIFDASCYNNCVILFGK